MELLSGHELGHLLGYGPLSVGLAVDCVLQARRGAGRSTSRGHRSRATSSRRTFGSRTAPDEFASREVINFGISSSSSRIRRQQKLTQTQSIFGSPSYMSPGRIRSAKHVDQRTDVWALGIVLHECSPPRFLRGGQRRRERRRQSPPNQPRALRQVSPDAPPELEPSSLRLLEKDPSRRMTLSELGLALKPFRDVDPCHLALDRLARVARRSSACRPRPPAATSKRWSAAGIRYPTNGRTGRSGMLLWRFSLLGNIAGLAVVDAFVGVAATTKKGTGDVVASSNVDVRNEHGNHDARADRLHGGRAAGLAGPADRVPPPRRPSAAPPAPAALAASANARKVAPARFCAHKWLHQAPSRAPAERPPEISEDRK